MSRTRGRAVLTAALTLFLSLCVQAADEAPTPVGALGNGLTLIVRENHAAAVCSVRVYVKTGAMLEGKYLGAGISHVLEHVVSGGTTKWRTEKQYEQLVDRLGGNANAATSLAWTRYHIDTTAENVYTAIDILSEYMLGASISWLEWNREMGVINRELERALDDPDRVIHELAGRNMFKVHPSRHPVIGYKSVLNNISYQDVIDYYSQRYVPNNMVVAAVGDFDAGKVKAHIEKVFSRKDRRPVPVITLPEEPVQVAPRRVIREKEGVRGTRLRIDYRTVELTHPDLYPLDVISYILSQGQSSRLIRRLRDEKQLVHSIRTWSVTPSYGAGYFAVYAQLDARNLDAAETAIVEELERLGKELVSEEELQRAKIQKISDHAFGQQTVGAQADELAFNYLATFDPDFGRHYTDNIQKVTREQIRAVAGKYFKPEKLCLTALVPKGQVQVAEEPASAVETTQFRKVKLPNGVVLLLKRNGVAPIVTMQAYFAGGLRGETKETNGLSSLMAAMLRRGTKSRTAEEIAKAFDGMGGTLITNSGSNSFYVTADVLSQDVARAMEIFADVILNPTFPEDEFEKMKARRLFFIKRSQDDAMLEAMRFFRENLFLKSPYGMVPQGTLESVSSVKRDDLVAFHRRYVHPENMVFAIVGDMNPAEAEELVVKHFGGFRGHGSFLPPSPAVEPPLEESRTAVKVTQKQTAVVFVGTPGLKMADLEDRAVIAVIDAVMSGYGYPGGWLHTELRGQKLVYEVHGFSVPGVERGLLAIYARCQPGKVKQVADTIQRNVMRMAISGASEAEIELAKNLIVTSEELQRQTNGSQAVAAALGELYGIGYDYEAQFLQRVKKVTPKEVKDATRKYFKNYVGTVTTPDAGLAESIKPEPRVVR